MKFSAKDLAFTGLSAAVLAVCAWISIPAPVPFTLQTFAVFLIVGLLGGKRGTMAVVVYLLLGAVGLPVFAGFRGGIGVLLGSTGGYLIGLVGTALVLGLVTRLAGDKLWASALGMTLGLLVCYAFGTVWFLAVYTRANGAVALGTVLGWCVLPFILPDGVKLALALLLSRRLRGRLPR